MKVFKCPSQAILNSPLFNETILIFMHQFQNPCLKPISQKFCNNLDGAVKQGDGPVIISAQRRVFLWDKGYEGSIDAMQGDFSFIKVMN